MSLPQTASACTCQLVKPLADLQSPIGELLSTFAAPSREECIIVRERMAHISMDISQLDNEIERLRYNRADLHKLHAQVDIKMR